MSSYLRYKVIEPIIILYLAQSPQLPSHVRFTSPPIELERQIIEIAAEESLESAANLMLVCQRMRQWYV